MRLPVVLLVLSLAGVVGGAFLIGLWAVGVAIVFDSLCVGVLALRLDDGRRPEEPPTVGAVTLQQVFDRARGAA